MTFSPLGVLQVSSQGTSKGNNINYTIRFCGLESTSYDAHNAATSNNDKFQENRHPSLPRLHKRKLFFVSNRHKLICGTVFKNVFCTENLILNFVSVCAKYKSQILSLHKNFSIDIPKCTQLLKNCLILLSEERTFDFFCSYENEINEDVHLSSYFRVIFFCTKILSKKQHCSALTVLFLTSSETHISMYQVFFIL